MPDLKPLQSQLRLTVPPTMRGVDAETMRTLLTQPASDMPGSAPSTLRDNPLGWALEHGMDLGRGFVAGDGSGTTAQGLGALLASVLPIRNIRSTAKALKSTEQALLAGPAFEKALNFYVKAGGLEERSVPRMALALRDAGIKVPAKSAVERMAAHKIVGKALDIAHTPIGPLEGPFASKALIP